MYQGPVSDERLLRQALEETLQTCGEIFRKAILTDLESMNRDNPSCGAGHLDMGMISDSLKRYFGLDAYEMIMHRVIARVKELATATVVV